MLLFSVICWEFLAVVRLHLAKLFSLENARKKKSPKNSTFFLSRHLPGEKFIQLNKHVLQAIYSLPLITFHTNICPNLVPLSGLDFFWAIVAVKSPGAVKSQKAMPKKQFGMGELRSFLVDTFIGDEYPNLYLEPKWPPFWLKFRPCFWGVDLQK